MLGHDLEMACTKFQGNRFRIDGESDEKHALQIIYSSNPEHRRAAMSVISRFRVSSLSYCTESLTIALSLWS